MAVTELQTFAHLSEDDIRAIGDEMRAIRRDVEAGRGQADATYINRTIALQRGLEVAGRVIIAATTSRTGAVVGALTLGLGKIIENLEIGHNTLHGQWDWMNDPEVHSTTWEWDISCPSRQWKHSHNFVHHKYTNVVGLDDDIGYGLLRVTRDMPWEPSHLAQPLTNVFLALVFQHGVALYDTEPTKIIRGEKPFAEAREELMEVLRKEARQLAKDYIAFPLATRRGWRSAATANLAANLLRNVWAYLVIFCGHFPDGAEKFSVAHYENETPDEWYLRQMLGSANFTGGRVLSFLAGNLNHQIEHHLFPDLPSNRLAEIAPRVRALCERYDLPYNTGNFWVQQWEVQRTLLKLSLPDSWLRDTSDDATETRSEKVWSLHADVARQLGTDVVTGARRGLATGRALLRRARRGRARALA